MQTQLVGGYEKVQFDGQPLQQYPSLEKQLLLLVNGLEQEDFNLDKNIQFQEKISADFEQETD